MSDSPEGLVMIEAEHPTGWGATACYQCHSLGAMHQNACTPGIDQDVLREVVEANGEHGCRSCHGDNGVATAPEADDDVAESPLADLIELIADGSGDTSEEVDP